MKRYIPIVLILIFTFSLCSCSKSIDYIFIEAEDQISSVSIINAELDSAGAIKEQPIKSITDSSAVAAFINDLKDLKCIGIGEGETPSGLLENDAKATVIKLEYQNGDIEYINYFGQASKIGGTLDYSATQGTFERVDFNALLNKYIQN